MGLNCLRQEAHPIAGGLRACPVSSLDFASNLAKRISPYIKFLNPVSQKIAGKIIYGNLMTGSQQYDGK